MESESYFKNNRQDSITKTFYRNGQIASYCEWSAGLVDGIEKFYYQNGVLKLIGQNINDIKIGVWQHYTKEGNLIKKEFYSNGVLDSTKIVE